nr:integrase, catalytic region, zinc finger, CCHC-type, peptidase aspartic, catalytic [Tanacetum cinerariifolium]
NKVAIGYKNPLCLTRAKQAQHALYNGHEILKDNHARAKVHNTEDTLEIAEITRKKMNAKMTDPKCVTHKSNDLMKLKSKALKERDKSSSNNKLSENPHFYTNATVLEFDKTCKKRITPSAVTDGEWGFEHTKACYLQEVIPFFQTIKDNFKGIQKALAKEVKQMKDVFEELEAEVAQSTKSELNVARFAEMYVTNTSVEDSIGNNPLTPEKDTPYFDSVFVIGKMQASLQGKDNVIRQLKKQLSELQVTNSDTECTIKVRTTNTQFTKVTDPVTNLQAQNDRFRAENDKVKQHYKQLHDSIKITHAKHIEQVTKLTAENVTLKTSVSKAKVQPSVLTRTKHAVDVELIVPRLRNNRDAHLDYLRHLKESVETIHDIVEEAKVVRPLDRSIVFSCRYTQHSQELLEYAIGTCPQGSQQ